MFEQTIKHCEFLLHNYPDAENCRNYLNSRLTMESQRIFQFGYFPNCHNLSVLFSLINPNELIAEKLVRSRSIEDALFPRTIYESYFEHYPLIMPFKDPYGNIVALVGRTLLSEEERQKEGISKYKNTIFKKGNYIFGLFEGKTEILKKNKVYIVEGQFDVIKAHERGIKNVIALGNANISMYQFSVILRYTNNLMLLLDNDEAGNKGRKSMIEKYAKLSNITNCYLPPEYKDIDEFLTLHTAADFYDALESTSLTL